MNKGILKQTLAECIGTFALVFCGTGAVIIDQQTNGAIGHVGIAITFGLVVLTMVYALGDISGAHINPAVTIAFIATGQLSIKKALLYIASQLAGAFIASIVLYQLFPQNKMLGTTMPAGSDMQSLVMEVILTFFLMFVILNVTSGAKEKGITAGIAIGSVICLDAMFGGPISGASMNPARSLAPAIITGNMNFISHQWIYVVGPIAGALLSVLAFKLIQPEKPLA